jgi:uncharacterized membrane protein YedE/YeeE
MAQLRTPPALPAAARFFNLAVMALVFTGMLVFAGWVIVSAATDGVTASVRVLGGMVIAAAAVTLLAAVREEWISGDPVQHTRTGQLGFALLAIGMAFFIAGMASER